MLYPNVFPGTSKPIVIKVKGSYEAFQSTYVDLASLGFHGLLKVEVLNPDLAVLKELPEKGLLDFLDVSQLQTQWTDLSGLWSSNIGNIHLTQEGDQVRGVLIHQDPPISGANIVIRGVFLEGRIEYTWSWAKNGRRADRPQGHGMLELSKDGNELVGWHTDFDIERGETRQSWSIHRVKQEAEEGPSAQP